MALRWCGNKSNHSIMTATVTATAAAEEKFQKMIEEVGGRYENEEYDQQLRKSGLEWLNYNQKSCEGYIRDSEMGKDPHANAGMIIRARDLVRECPLNQRLDFEELEEDHVTCLIYKTMKRLLREGEEVVGPLLHAECLRVARNDRDEVARLMEEEVCNCMMLSVYNAAQEDLKSQYEYVKSRGPRDDDVFRHAARALRAAVGATCSPKEERRKLMEELEGKYAAEAGDKELVGLCGEWLNGDPWNSMQFLKDFVEGDESPEARRGLEKLAMDLVDKRVVALAGRELPWKDVKVHAHYVIYLVLCRIKKERGVNALKEECMKAVEEKMEDVEEFLKWAESVDEDSVPTGFPTTFPPLDIYDKAMEDLMLGFEYGYGQAPSVDCVCRHAAEALKSALLATTMGMAAAAVTPEKRAMTVAMNTRSHKRSRVGCD